MSLMTVPASPLSDPVVVELWEEIGWRFNTEVGIPDRLGRYRDPTIEGQPRYFEYWYELCRAQQLIDREQRTVTIDTNYLRTNTPRLVAQSW